MNIAQIDPQERFRCDACGAIFGASQVVRVKPVDNFQILTPLRPFVFVDKDGNIVGGYKQADGTKGDEVLACPGCGEIHLFGFDKSN